MSEQPTATATSAATVVVESDDDKLMAQYEADLKAQSASGPWEIGAEQKQKNRQVMCALVAAKGGVVPFDDINKVNDCDLIYRFLIAQRWDVQKTIDALTAYAAWRKENKMNEIMWEIFPEELDRKFSFAATLDFGGRPVILSRPKPADLSVMLEKYSRPVVIRHQLKITEMGRRLCKSVGVDRLANIFDMYELGFSVVSNMTAMSMLKEVAATIQTYFPENTKVILILNQGYAFNAIFAMLKLVLDERVQNKFVPCGSGEAAVKALSQHMNTGRLPKSYGGSVPDEAPPHLFKAFADIPTSPPGSPNSWPRGAFKDAPLCTPEEAAAFFAAAAAARAASPPSSPAGAAAAAAAR